VAGEKMSKYPICEFLSLAMLTTNKTMSQLGKEIGVSISTLAKWKDNSIPPKDKLSLIQSALGVDLMELEKKWDRSVVMKENLRKSGLVVRKR